MEQGTHLECRPIRPAAVALLIVLKERLEDSAPLVEVLKRVFERECVFGEGSVPLDADSLTSLCLALLDCDSTKEAVEGWCLKSEIKRDTGTNAEIVSTDVTRIVFSS